MEHIRQFDWCSSEPDIYFLKENDLDNCVTEQILRNKFHDPMISSESEEESSKPKFDWNQVFKRNNRIQEARHHGHYIAGMRSLPPYPRQSMLTRQQHNQGLRVMTAVNKRFPKKPSNQDLKAVQEFKETYETEQKEYIDWAKTLWTTTQCVRALRPKPTIETVYEAEFKIKASEMKSFPKKYEMAAQISFESNHNCQMIHMEDLINVNVMDLPLMEWPDLTTGRVTVLRPCPTPVPCNKHPTRMLLPNEKSVSILPLTEVHRSLCQYGVDYGARVVASESALRCLVRGDQWTLPITVAEGRGADGENMPVLVLGSEFSLSRGYARTRTYRALKHLLEYALIPPLEKAKVLKRHEKVSKANGTTQEADREAEGMEVDSDEENYLVIAVIDENKDDSEEENLQIEEDETVPDTCLNESDITSSPKRNTKLMSTEESCKETSEKSCTNDNHKKGKDEMNTDLTEKPTYNINDNWESFYKCTCKDSIFEMPPPRSYRKWQLKNCTTKQDIDIIVHCSHKVRADYGEVIMEPIPEYQLDLGGSAQPEGMLRAQELSLLLRRNASLITARVDGVSGDLVMLKQTLAEQFHNADRANDVIRHVYTAIDQLMGLLPGHYLLRHEPNHGNNALLYAPRLCNQSNDTITLDFDSSQPLDETVNLRVPPVLEPVLLPMHKHRRILPCAFTPNEFQVAKEQKKPPAKQKAPPQAIRWPKRKGLRKKKPANTQ